MDTCEIVNCSSYIVFVCVCVLMHMCVLEYMPGGHMWECMCIGVHVCILTDRLSGVFISLQLILLR